MYDNAPFGGIRKTEMGLPRPCLGVLVLAANLDLSTTNSRCLCVRSLG